MQPICAPPVEVKSEMSENSTSSKKRSTSLSRSFSSHTQVIDLDVDSSPGKKPRVASMSIDLHQDEVEKDLHDFLGATPWILIA
eukprot:1216015-Amphidinium_carterae.4